MASQYESATFNHRFWFVDPQEPRLNKAARSHSKRESHRLRKWSRARFNRDRGSSVPPGGLKWMKRAHPLAKWNQQDENQQNGDAVGCTVACRSIQGLSLPSIQHVGKLDPEYGFPLAVGREEPSPTALISYYMIHRSGRYLCGIDPGEGQFLLSQELFLLPALQDPAAFYALCAVASWVWNKSHSIAKPVQAIRYKNDAVCLIKENIHKKKLILDPTVLAVALLWKLEARCDDLEYMELHVKGLMQMITLRGGLRVLDPRLQLLLAWFTSSHPGTFALPFYGPGETTAKVSSPREYFALCSQEFIDFLRSVSNQTAQIRRPTYAALSDFFVTSRTTRHLLSPAYHQAQVLSQFRERRLLIAFCRLACLLWLHCPQTDPAQLCGRFAVHDLEHRGSIVMLWNVLLKDEKGIAIDDQAWPVIRMMSVAKQMSLDLVDEVADLLMFRLANEPGYPDEKAAGLIARVRRAVG